MKTIKLILLFLLFSFMLLVSCEFDPALKVNDTALEIEFSDGTIIVENDIEFYDSSTCTYFLKSELLPNENFTDFKIKVNNDSILGGVFFSCFLSSMPPTPYFISDCFFSGFDVLKIGYYGDGKNRLNDEQIINSLKENNLFRRGLSCQIDSVQVVESGNETNVICTIKITNNDNIAYYIPDVNKMGERYYTDYTGGLSFSNMNKGPGSFIKDSNSNRQRDDIKISDLEILKANSEVTYRYTSRNYHPIPAGEYRVGVRFMGIVYTASEFDLDQKKGRVWVGELYAVKDGIMVE
ncbi:MAG: hypothetical protein ACERKD_19565 [Prolixibacteraceae bacterium]